jgi:hypothetical protein
VAVQFSIKFLRKLLDVLSFSYYGKIDFKIPFYFKTLFKIIVNWTLPSLIKKHFAKIVYSVLEKMGDRAILAVIPDHYFMQLSVITFYGIDFKVPAKTEEYLTYRYGKDWRNPKKDWMYFKDNGAIYQKDRMLL